MKRSQMTKKILWYEVTLLTLLKILDEPSGAGTNYLLGENVNLMIIRIIIAIEKFIKKIESI